MDKHSLIDSVFEKIDLAIDYGYIITKSDIRAAKQTLEEVLDAFLLTRGSNEVQASLFKDEVEPILHVDKNDPYSLDRFWASYPKKVGKKKAKEYWKKEIGSKHDAVIRLWNAFYRYLVDIKKTRRQGFFRQFKDGYRFLKDHLDWIGYGDTLILDIEVVIDKCTRILDQIDKESNANLQVAKITQPIDLQEHYKEEW